MEIKRLYFRRAFNMTCLMFAITYLGPAGGCEGWRCVAEERGNNNSHK